jgi:hypothetical protein
LPPPGRPYRDGNFLQSHAGLYGLSAADVSTLRLESESVSRSGLRMVRGDQAINGIPVFQSDARFVLDDQGRLIRTIGAFAPAAAAAGAGTTPGISPAAALVAAMRSVGITIDARDVSSTIAGTQEHLRVASPDIKGRVTSTLVYFPLAPGIVTLAYQQFTFTRGTGDYLTVVDASTGAVLWRKNARAYQTLPTQEARFSVYVQGDGKTPADSPARSRRRARRMATARSFRKSRARSWRCPRRGIWERFADRGFGFGAAAPLAMVGTTGSPYWGHMSLRTSNAMPSLAIDATTIDDSLGNNNGAIDPGEPVRLGLTLRNPFRNAALYNAPNASATLTTSTPGVTIVNGTTTFGALPVQGSAPGTPLLIRLDQTPVCGSAIDFTLTVTSALGASSSDFLIRVGTAAGTGAPITYTKTAALGLPDANNIGVIDAMTITDDFEIANLDFRIDNLRLLGGGTAACGLRHHRHANRRSHVQRLESVPRAGRHGERG